MRVKRLTMRSFRGIDDLTLEFDPIEPTVLIGINGVGKSTVLACISMLIHSLIHRIRFPPRAKPLIINGKEVKGTEPSHDLEDIKDEHSETFTEITISLDKEEFNWSIAGNRDSHKIQESRTQELREVADIIRHQLESNPSASLPLLVYYPDEREVIENNIFSTRRHSIQQIAAYDELVNFKSFFNWLSKEEHTEEEEQKNNPNYRNKQLEAVRHAVISMLPDFSYFETRTSPPRISVTKRNLKLFVTQLSSGEKILLTIAGDLARRLAIANPGLSAPLQGEGVVLIDEIELHLHPQWQRGIVPKLTRTFPNCQFIVTTHSPQVISDVKPNGIYILESTPDGIKARRPESSFGKDSNSILEDLMGVPERPQSIKNELRHLFRLIDEGNLEEARKIQEQLEALIGSDEPEFSRADFLIRRKEILGR